MNYSAARIAVIVVNWNGWRHTLKALKSLENSDKKNWHLYIVDNDSGDNSVSELSDIGPNATLLTNSCNAGFAGGCNIGIAAALEAESEYIFLLNNDATVEPDTLSKLLTASTIYPNAALGCLVRFNAGNAVQFFGSSISPASGTPVWHREEEDMKILENEFIETDFVFGAALFAPAEMFVENGLFDERFFLTYEETDWCYRVRKAGYRCFVVRDAIVKHEGSASLGSITSPLQAYFLQRNRLLFLEKHGSPVQRLQGLRHCCRSIRDAPSVSTRRAIIIALRDYITRRFGDSPASVRTSQRAPVL